VVVDAEKKENEKRKTLLGEKRKREVCSKRV
jgi:hypothetical protein